MKDDIIQISLTDIESVAQGEAIDCRNVTYIPNEALRTAQCWNGATHKKCKSQDNVCCNPDSQTDCSPIIGKK